ncbi:MAG TPA: hypothetical protein VHB45_13935 [Alloacidobacterium sp.]|nr:hypothetical protein [Alloacidobacterium sp.]
MSSSRRSFVPLKNCALPEPLHSGNEYYLCPTGFALNLQHAEAQKEEASASCAMDLAHDELSRLQKLEVLKTAVTHRHNAMNAQFEHIKDCFICSVAFGLTPDPTPDPKRAPSLFDRLIKLAKVNSLSH